MKRIFLVCVVLFSAVAVQAQDAEKLEDIKRLNADMESLIGANARMQKEIASLSAAVQSVREENSAAASKNNVQEELRRLAEKLQEVDKKREADKQLILEKLSEFAKIISAGTSSRTPRNPPRETNSSGTGAETARTEKSPVSDKGYEHLVQKGEYLSTIVQAYNEKFKEKGMKTLSVQQVIDANPGLKPERLRVGQKVFIPQP